MELPDDLKPDLHHTLLGPLSLADEIFGALLPGCIFSMTLLFKGRLATSLLSYPQLGYKTKIACALLASYVFGKAALSTVTLVAELWELVAEKVATPKEKESKSNDPTGLQFLSGIVRESSAVKYFLYGVVGSPLFFKKSRLYEYYVAYNAASLFYLSAGLLFLVATAIPGDGNLRLVEATAGVILLIRGLRSKSEMNDLVAALIGVMAGSTLAEFQPTQIAQGIRVVVAVLKQLGQPMSSLVKNNTDAGTKVKAEDTAAGTLTQSTEKSSTSSSEKTQERPGQ
jgi:hypothetical protein